MAGLILTGGVVLLAFMYGEMYHSVLRPGVRENDHPPDLAVALLRRELSYHKRHHHHVPKHLRHLADPKDDNS